MEAALGGYTNVRPVQPRTMMGSNFSGWCEGAQLIVFEEVRIRGQNRYAIINHLKPFITEDTVEVHRKGIDSYSAPNVSNYLLFSNYRDALPISAHDRRYFVTFSRFESEEDVREFGRANPDYFKDLYAGIRGHGGAIRKWLLEYPISEGFDACGRAPGSASRQAVADANRTDLDEIFDTCADDEKLPLINRSWVSATELIRVLDHEYPDAKLARRDGNSIRRFLTGRNYKSFGRMRAGGTQHSLWVKKGDPRAIRTELNRAVRQKFDKNAQVRASE